MKKLLLLPVVFLLGCRSDAIVTPVFGDSSVNLGMPSQQLLVVASSGPLTSGPLSITVDVTPNATYSFQLTHINGNVLNNYGFTANASRMTITLNYAAVPNGAYDLNLMDNTGRLLKVPVIVQH